MFDRMRLDDPVGALSAHGLAGIWGTLACGLFTSDRLAEYVGVGKAGPVLRRRRRPARRRRRSAVGATFAGRCSSCRRSRSCVIKATIGLRVADEDEDAGLDIAEHGMYGYPEQFIPALRAGGVRCGPARPSDDPAGALSTRGQEVPAT